MKTKTLYYLILFLNFSFLFSFKCGHDKIKKPPKRLNDSFIINDTTRKLDDSYHSISFFVDYTQMNYDAYGTSEYRNFIKKSIDSTIKVFSELIKVKRTGNLSIKNPLRCSQKITKYHSSITTGIDYDIVLVPIIDPNLEDGVDAAASSCFLGSDYRPIMGYVLLNQNYSYKKTNAQQFLTMLLLHEITHVLVFSDDLYSYFQYSDATITKTINGIKRTLIQTPKVLSVASQHFGCSSITGIELENQGGEGSAGSHWEARVMLGDYMISTDYPEIVISDISLALFEDSGWYQVNYYTGGLFRFGKGQGCEFLESACVSSGESNFEWDFCDVSYENKCTSNNLNRGYCYLRNYSYISSSYQYFSNSRLGGWEIVDYCPVTMTYSSSSYFFSGSCINGEINSYEIYYPSSFGFNISDSSICIQSSLINSNDKSLSIYEGYERAMCHKIECNFEDKTINVDIGETIIECPTNGGYIEVDGYNGTIRCPPFNRVCTSSTFVGDSITAALNHIPNEDIDSSYKSGSYSITMKFNRIIISIFILFFLFI